MNGKKNKTKFSINAFFVFVVAAIVAFGFAIAYFFRLPEFGETYGGTISESSYETIESASCAYLQAEIDSASRRSEFVSCQRGKTLSANAIEDLRLGEEFQSVEEVEVVYKIGETVYKRKIYACYLEENGYKYFSPPAYVGEDITSSYYQSVISKSKFENFTLKLRSVSAISLYGVPIRSTTEYTMQVANGVAYYKEESGFLWFKSTREIYAYDGIDGIYGVAKESLSGFDADTGEHVSESHDWEYCEVMLPFGTVKRISDFSMFGLYDGMDHSFFEKTKTGFASKRSLREEFSRIVLQNLTERVKFESGYDSEVDIILKAIYESDGWQCDCNYIVEEGRLRQTYLKEHLDYKNIDWEKIVGETPPDWFNTFMQSFSVDSSMVCDIIDIDKTSFVIDKNAQRMILASPY